jgi:NhaP-type Na+/H+ or K+/H+ antiporter
VPRHPQSLVSSIEDEGLFNDATALVAYGVAVAAVVAGATSRRSTIVAVTLL